jgi:transcriptional regulator with XRE-family HTH domain
MDNMSSKDRNAEIRKLYEIDGWTQETIALKFGISTRQVRRILKVDITGHKVDIPLEKIEKQILTINYDKVEVPKYGLFKDGKLIESSNDLTSFEDKVGKLSIGKLNWLNERLETNSNTILGDYEVKLSKNAKEDKESQTLESALKRIDTLEKTLIEIMQNTTDNAIINTIKKNLKL